MAKTNVCKQCGQPHLTKTGKPSCAGHSRGRLRPEIAGKPCRQSPIKGGTVCRNHGGKAPQVKAKAAENLARAESQEQQRKLALTLGDSPILDKDPSEIIAEQIGWRARHVQWLRTRVQAVDPDALVWGKTKFKDGGDDRGTTHEAKPNAWLLLYVEASAALEKLCIDAVRVGLEARRVKLAELDAELWVAMIDGVLTDLGHDPDSPDTAEVVERHLRSVG